MRRKPDRLPAIAWNRSSIWRRLRRGRRRHREGILAFWIAAETSGDDDGRGENLRGILHEVLLGDGWTHADEAVVLFDDDRNYLAVNDAYCALIGYSREGDHDVE